MARMKIPRSVAGVKIPKKVRRKAKKAVKMAESPVVREFAAAALGAAAQSKAAGAKARAGSNGTRLTAGTAVRIDGDKLADVVRAAALDGIRRFLEGFEEGLRNAAASIDGDAGEKGAGAPGGRRSSGSSAGGAAGG